MGLERHGEMKLGIYKASNEKLGIAVESQDFELDGMHESVKQAPLRDFLVENNDVEKSQGVHVRDLGQIRKTQRPGFRVEGRIGAADTLEFENPYLIEQGGRKIRPHKGLLVLTETLSGAEITLALITQIGRDPGDSLPEAFVG